MRALTPVKKNLLDDGAGHKYRYCANYYRHKVCNWLCPGELPEQFCFGCNFNRAIPDLSIVANINRWRRLEAAKKRVLYTLMSIGLPLQSGHSAPGGLLFDFLEDGRSDPARLGGLVVNTGHLDGVITVNVLEADDAAREAQRAALGENYRTLLGHMRHEMGHYYHAQMLNLLTTAAERDELRALFGDERDDYAAALTRYYAQGPDPEARRRCITAYASSHPLEDWAETWGHYLHIVDVLETAEAHGVVESVDGERDFAQRINVWRPLSVTLNELNRSVGLGDAYPFVVTGAVQAKLAYVDASITRLGTPR
jgi:hypothetical protein